MHYRMLITISLPENATSDEARSTVHEALLNDDSFCGTGGRFGRPMCDWFVIGGRWSGMLAKIAIGASYKDSVHARFPELASDWWPESVAEKNKAELDAIWQAHGGTGPSPYTRTGYEELGFPDDAVILTQSLYDALLTEYEGHSATSDYADLDDEELSADFVGHKWLVVVDYHN
jgi:hypothetical protein